MVNEKQSGEKIASEAGKILQDENSSEIQKELAASVLSQTKTKKQTGKDMEEVASNVMKSKKYNKITKSLAASLLAQSNKKR